MQKKQFDMNHGLMAVGFLLLIIILWLPFDIKSGDVREHWHIRTMIDIGETQYDNLRDDYLIELALTRPIARLLYWFAYYLSPDSFIADNLLLMLILWLKGLALMAVILKLFPHRYFLAFSIAVLALVYPADVASSSLRIPHIHFATLAYFIAIFFLLNAWETGHKRYLMAMSICLLMVGLSYEALYPVVFATPLLLLIRERRISWRLIRYAIAWYIPVALTLMYSLALIFGMGFGFQSAATNDGFQLSYIVIKHLRLYQRIFLTGWDFRSVGLNAIFVPYVLVFSLLFLLVSSLLWYRNRNQEQAFRRWEFAGFALASFVLVALGYLMYVPTNRSGSDLVYRVFLNSSIAGAALIAVIGYQLALIKTNKLGISIWMIILSLGVGLGSFIHLNRHDVYSRNFFNQRAWLEPVLEIVPALEAPAYIFLVPAPNLGNSNSTQNFFHTPHLLSSALQYVYGQSSSLDYAMVCKNLENVCQFSSEGITVFYDRVIRPDYSILYPAENLIIIQINEDDSLSLLSEYPPLENYNPENLIADNDALPPRFYSIFED